MKHLALVVVLSLSIIFFASCRMAPMQGDDSPTTDAAAIWTYITQTAPYTEWGMFMDAPGFREADPPHGPFVKIYANGLANSSVYKAKPGSIIVMENYDKDQTTLLNIALMQKRQDYAPSAGNWFWVKYEPDGTVVEEGKIQKCIECHVSMAFDDYTFVHQW